MALGVPFLAELIAASAMPHFGKTMGELAAAEGNAPMIESCAKGNKKDVFSRYAKVFVALRALAEALPEGSTAAGEAALARLTAPRRQTQTTVDAIMPYVPVVVEAPATAIVDEPPAAAVRLVQIEAVLPEPAEQRSNNVRNQWMAFARGFMAPPRFLGAIAQYSENIRAALFLLMIIRPNWMILYVWQRVGLVSNVVRSEAINSVTAVAASSVEAVNHIAPDMGALPPVTMGGTIMLMLGSLALGRLGLGRIW